jgi:hypothetical protein
MIERPLTIKIMTRDRPETLIRTITSVINDLSKCNLKPDVYLIDDSLKRENRKKNELLLKKIPDTYRSEYFGRSDFKQALSNLTPKNKITRWFGYLGDPEYLPCRTKNISLWIETKSKYQLFIDDDIIIDPNNRSPNSLIERTLKHSLKFKSLTSTVLSGRPDISFIELFDTSFAGPQFIHPWRQDNSNICLSGGFLMFPSIACQSLFPMTYNEDFMWVAYCSSKYSLRTGRLHLDVSHRPGLFKIPSIKRMEFEARGEIFYETFRRSNIMNFIEMGTLPSNADIKTVKSDYIEYINYILQLSPKPLTEGEISNSVINQVDFNQSRKRIQKVQEYIKKLKPFNIQNFFKSWFEQLNEWNKMSRLSIE